MCARLCARACDFGVCLYEGQICVCARARVQITTKTEIRKHFPETKWDLNC